MMSIRSADSYRSSRLDTLLLGVETLRELADFKAAFRSVWGASDLGRNADVRQLHWFSVRHLLHGKLRRDVEVILADEFKGASALSAAGFASMCTSPLWSRRSLYAHSAGGRCLKSQKVTKKVHMAAAGVLPRTCRCGAAAGRKYI